MMKEKKKKEEKKGPILGRIGSGSSRMIKMIIWSHVCVLELITGGIVKNAVLEEIGRMVRRGRERGSGG